MKIKSLKKVIHSSTGSMQFSIVYDSQKKADVESGCSVEYVIKNYGEKELKRLEAFENQLIFII